ncbi:MAG: YlmC/YmxH family sporulation protein [Clostridia bacterium]|nr:YlmC/YmxH family sporulation protein [Clostridia bacterium]
MLYTLRELERKDVINLCSGRFLGHVCDIELENDCGRVTALYVCQDGIFGCNIKERIRIAWDKIKCIGEDTIIVEQRTEDPCEYRSRRKGNWCIW